MASRIPSINEHKAAQSDALKNKVNAEYNQSQQTVQPQQTAVELQPQAVEQPVQQPQTQPTSVTPVAPAKPLNTIPSVDSDPSKGLTVGKPYEYLSEKDFEARRGEFGNVSDKEYWSAQLKKNPDSAYTILMDMFASNETPEQKRKRERSEQLGEVFRNLGNVIGNAANLYYTHRGGQYIDLNTANEKHRERLQKLKDKQAALKEKQDAMLIDARIKDLGNARADRLTKEKREADEKAADLAAKRKALQDEIKYKFDLGLIDARTKAALGEQAAKAKDAKELENLKQKNRVSLKQAPSASDSNVVDSAIGADGNIYTRNSKLTDNEAMQIVQSHVPDEDMEPFVTSEQSGYDSVSGQPIYKERTDWRAAAAYALQKGLVSVEELEQMGFKRGTSSVQKPKGKSLPGIETKKQGKSKHLNL